MEGEGGGREGGRDGRETDWGSGINRNQLFQVQRQVGLADYEASYRAGHFEFFQ